jgi:hypothetical protein
MKKLLGVVLALGACMGLSMEASSAPLLIEENFSYASGTLLTANGWTSHSGNTNFIPVTESGLTYPDYPSSGIGNAASLLTTGEDVNRTFTPQTSGSVYYAFLVNVSTAQATGDYFTHFGTNAWSTIFPGRVFCRSASGGVNFGVSRAGTGASVIWSSNVYALNATHLVVLKYTFVAGPANDLVDLFVNPASCPDEPLPTVSAEVETPGEPVNGIGGVGLRQGTATQAPTLWIDGLRVGTVWADVACSPPATGACCAGDGSCSVDLQPECVAAGGIYSGDDTTCSPNRCPQLGTCCAVDGTCTFVLQANCTGAWALGGACSPDPCFQPTGSCCALTGECTVTVESQCHGVEWTVDLTCEPNICVKPTGSCCDPYGHCTITLAADCFGPWTMFGTCAPVDCTLPTGACCHPDGVCVVTLQDDCSDPWILNGGCEPSTCATSGVDAVGPITVFSVQASPNPFAGRVALRIAGPRVTAARVLIVDASGRLVRTAWNGMLNGRAVAVTWDGRDDFGRDTAPGIYMVRLVSGSGHAIGRLVKLR